MYILEKPKDNCMEEYVNEADETLSLSDLQKGESSHGSAEVNQDFYQDFFGFSNEEWVSNSYMNSPEKLVSFIPDDTVTKPKRKVEESNPLFRSSSGSFKYMRFKIASAGTGTWRSKSVSVMEKSRMMSTSKSKSRWQVFTYGFGSGKFPIKMDLSDIKSRQLRQQTTTTESTHVVDQNKSSDRRSRKKKKVWWWFVDVLGCSGG